MLTSARPAGQARRARPAARCPTPPTTRTCRRRCRSASSCRWSPASGCSALCTAAPPTGPGLALGTRQGVVKRVNPEVLGQGRLGGDPLEDGDEVVGAVELATGDGDALLHHLRRPAAALRRRRRSGPRAAPAAASPASGSPPASGVVWFGAVDPDAPEGSVVVTVVRLVDRAARHRARRGQGDAVRGVPRQGPRHRRRALPPLPQGRGHPGLRLGRHRARPGPRRPAARRSTCPRPTGRRDGSGVPGSQPIAACAGPVAARLGVQG